MEILPNGLIDRSPPAPLPFGPASIADILSEGVRRFPERLAVIDRHQRREWTWAELDARVGELAAGFEPGRPYRIGVGDDIDKILLALAAWRAAAVVIFSSSRSLPEEAIEAAFGRIEAIASIGHATNVGNRGGKPPEAVDPLAPAAVAATSGTSGTPKLVVHSQRSLLIPPLVSSDVDPPSPSERILTPLNPGILNVMVLGALSAFVRGSTLVLPNKAPNGPNWVTATRIQRVTRLVVVPPQLGQMIVQTDPGKDDLSLERVLVGGSGAKPEDISAFTERFGVRPTASYGLTEAPTGVVRASEADPVDARRGFALPHIQVSVHDVDGQELERGTEGQIWVSPATEGTWANVWAPALGYLGDPERTRDVFAGGSLKTGDKGIIDSDGALRVTGRLSDVIIRGGMNLDPTEIEAILLDDPEVADALVVGIDDARLGQRVGAVIARTTPAAIDTERLRHRVESQLSKHHVPDVIVTAQKLAGSITTMGKRARHLPAQVFTDGDRHLRGSLSLFDGSERIGRMRSHIDDGDRPS